MKADGTVNRAALPAIFNPEDMNALEQALRVKDAYPGSKITLLTMGPGRAAEVLREGLYRGADAGVLLTDRRFGGSDTLATSYALASAIRKLEADIIFAGRQAIDGDTAQVGPQIAQKLNLPQVTYVESLTMKGKSFKALRRLDNGSETVKGKLPALFTVHSSAPPARSRNAKLVMKYKHAKTCTERQNESEDYLNMASGRPYLQLKEWSVDDVDVEARRLGISGSPTKVKTVQNIVLKSKDSRRLDNDDEQINALMKELIENHTIE